MHSSIKDATERIVDTLVAAAVFFAGLGVYLVWQSLGFGDDEDDLPEQ